MVDFDSQVARWAYVIGASLIACVILVGGLIDLSLWLHSEVTITAWLRKYPHCFVWPAVMMLAFLTALYLHLFWLD